MASWVEVESALSLINVQVQNNDSAGITKSLSQIMFHLQGRVFLFQHVLHCVNSKSPLCSISAQSDLRFQYKYNTDIISPTFVSLVVLHRSTLVTADVIRGQASTWVCPLDGRLERSILF